MCVVGLLDGFVVVGVVVGYDLVVVNGVLDGCVLVV